jgi:SOS-response transcriptional repressor LexA
MGKVGDRIREARERAGLSQAAVGAACDPPISGQAVYKWEKGKAGPSGRNLDILAGLTGRSTKWFLYGVENIPSAVNVSSETVQAGRDVGSVEQDKVASYLQGDWVPTKFVRTNFPCSNKAFQTFVTDHSNEPDLMLGDSVVVDPERAPVPGKFCLALTSSGEPVIRRFRPRSDHVELRPVNEDWPTIEVARDAIIGAITEITRPH